MKNLIALAILALGLTVGTIASVNTASAASWQQNAFEPKGP